MGSWALTRPRRPGLRNKGDFRWILQGPPEYQTLTRTPAVRKKQRLQVELLLADHNQDCASCIRHGNCELQDVAQFVGLQQTRYHYPHFYQERTLDTSSPAITRDMSKCIRCLRCVTVCREIQVTDVLVITERACRTKSASVTMSPWGSRIA